VEIVLDFAFGAVGFLVNRAQRAGTWNLDSNFAFCLSPRSLRIRSMISRSKTLFVLFCAVLVTGCANTQDRARMEQAAQENVSLKAQLTDLTAEHDKLKRDYQAVTKERDQYRQQIVDAKALQEKLTAAQTENTRAEGRLKLATDELSKAKSDLEAARAKSQADAEQANVKLKAAEDAVTAARAKATEAERAAAGAADAAKQAKDQVATLQRDNALLQQRIQSLEAAQGKKAAANDANK
jgi:outer membrane murein-binding lipoprotein Lpp